VAPLLQCGLCDTYYVAHVKEACAFLGEGNGRLPKLEARVHGRSRRLDNDELFFGVHEAMYNVAATNMPGAQWTGVVTTVAVAALRSGLVDAVACVGSHPDDPLKPVPMLALTPEQVLASRGVKPMLSPSLNVLAEVEARGSGIKRLMFIGVGCAVSALRGVEQHLGLEKLYVVGTNCTDNGRESGLRKFLQAVSDEPTTALGYEFMADYRVHIKHSTPDGALRYEKIPYFCLPAGELSEGVIAPSCQACFDYTNAGADLVVGYMGVPPQHGVPMTQHTQYCTVRNAAGRELLDAAAASLVLSPTVSSGDRAPLVMQTVLADDAAQLRGGQKPAPRWLGEALAWVLGALGPKGLEFARYSIEYHTIRNAIYTARHFPAAQAAQHVPPHAAAIVAAYDADGAIARRLAMRTTLLTSPTGPASGGLQKEEGGNAGRVAAAAAAVALAICAALLMSS
jgi:7-hydroxymethyl chlorophyll a reductase